MLVLDAQAVRPESSACAAARAIREGGIRKSFGTADESRTKRAARCDAGSRSPPARVRDGSQRRFFERPPLLPALFLLPAVFPPGPPLALALPPRPGL